MGYGPDTICVLKSRRFPIGTRGTLDGGTINVAHIVDGIVARGALVRAFTRREPGDPPERTIGAVTVHYVPYQPSRAANPLDRDLDEGLSFTRGLQQHPAFKPREFRCVHSHHWTSTVGLPETLEGVRIIHTPHLLVSEKAAHLDLACPPGARTAEAAILNRADAIVTLSRAERAAACNEYGISSSRVHVIYNGVSEPFFEVPPIHDGTSNSLIRIVSTARLCRQKGLDFLFDALEEVLRRGSEVSLSLIGDSYGETHYEQRLRERARDVPLRGRVSFLGQLTHDMVPAALATADLYLQPSRYESQGIALLEAMAAGRFVIASDLAAIREIVTTNQTGVLVPTGGTDEIVRAILEAAADSRRSASIALAAREAARPFTWARTVAQTLSLIWA